jgi:hypothetical protein
MSKADTGNASMICACSSSVNPMMFTSVWTSSWLTDGIGMPAAKAMTSRRPSWSWPPRSSQPPLRRSNSTPSVSSMRGK